VIYLKFLDVVLANVGACAHMPRTFVRTATVNKVFNLVISLWWMSRDRFFSEFTLIRDSGTC